MLLAALLHHLSAQKLRQIRLLMRPDTILRWHSELLNQCHATPRPARRSDADASAEMTGTSKRPVEVHRRVTRL